MTNRMKQHQRRRRRKALRVIPQRLAAYELLRRLDDLNAKVFGAAFSDLTRWRHWAAGRLGAAVAAAAIDDGRNPIVVARSLSAIQKQPSRHPPASSSTDCRSSDSPDDLQSALEGGRHRPHAESSAHRPIPSR